MLNNINITHTDLLHNLGIAKFNPMQKATIEKAVDTQNLILLAPTGSGKTIAFLTAIFDKLKADKKEIQALVIAPSRELSLQIEQVFKSMKTDFKVSCCYGGHDFKTEQNNLLDAPALVIGTPGRLADHVIRKSINLSTVSLIVLDEFDKSLQMGFQPQIETIFKAMRGQQQHILTSATNIAALPDFLPFTEAETLDFQAKAEASRLQFKMIRTEMTEKAEGLMRLVAGFNQEVCLVFCNHRDAVERISTVFTKNKFEHGIFHGGIEQIDREKNLIKFRGGAHNVLISTDLAARGLDIPEIKHIVHYQLPPNVDAFTHRNGRTARMHADGEAYLVLSADEVLPEYMTMPIEEIILPEELILPPPPQYACVYISAGKKEKISKSDIAGLMMKKGELKGDELGLITILDHASYISVKRSLVQKVLNKIKDERLKKQKVKVEIAK